MRIAVSGAHRVGKTTLVSAQSDALQDHAALEEPYLALEAVGHVFKDPPDGDDFEVQLELSIESIQTAGRKVIFDRCPADLLAYLAEQAPQDVVASYWTRTEQAMGLLDLVIYVPIERPDRIHVPPYKYPGLRKRVDRRLRQFLQGDELVPAARTYEVAGTVSERTRAGLVAIESLSA